MTGLFGRVGSRLADVLMPRTCAKCGATLPPEIEDLCATCWALLARSVAGRYCMSCGDEERPHLFIEDLCPACRLNRRTTVRFKRFARVGRYEEPLKSLILRFKREVVLERLLGRLLGEAIYSRLRPDEVDLWVPVPSHWTRRLVRGFQPTVALAECAVGRWNARIHPILEMTRYIPPLHAGMSPTRRLEAVRGAFRVKGRRSVANRTVCVIDDVTATGATLTEAKRALREAGVRTVYAAVLAKSVAIAGAASAGADLPEHNDRPQNREHPGVV